MPVETPAEQLLHCTVYIEADVQGNTLTGTSFLTHFTVGDSMVVALVTNKHVVQGATQIRFHFIAGDDETPSHDWKIVTLDNPGKFPIIGHPDPTVDVVAMPLGTLLAAANVDQDQIFFRTIDVEYLLTKKESEGLDAIEQVTFIGYPSGIFDTHSKLPIVRRGQTATPIYNDYRGDPAFLIDASVFPGSSGSPVVIYDQLFVDRQGNMTIGNTRFHVAGIVAAVHQRQVVGQVVELPAASIASFNDVIDLGIVFKASAIRECIDLMCDRFGVPRPKIGELA